MIWTKKTQDDIQKIVFDALGKNVNYTTQNILGIPASYLDDKVFNQDASFVKDAPFISSLIQNPNHIGCHTLNKSESFFKGTHEIEKELIEICAVDILKGQPNQQDGYVASGGTEANIQAIWVYRNYFKNKFSANNNEIAILCSDDAHYSMDKASNLLSIPIYKTLVNVDTRQLDESQISKTISNAKNDGIKYFIVVNNMMTTMFGSVDNVELYTNAFVKSECEFKLHIDGAYGGFYYPFTESENNLTFENKHISSFTLDAHKMAQAPYGTGIFIMRKGLIENVNTQEASYVEGEDYTLIGSRSGANAIAVWMILSKNGPYGWQEKIFILQKRTEWMCKQLDALNFKYFRHPQSNIITIKSQHIKKSIAEKFGLVPDNHQDPKWFKIVIMEHVTIEKLSLLLSDFKKN